MQALIHRQPFELINVSGAADRCPISVCVAFVISRHVLRTSRAVGPASASSEVVSQRAEMTAADNAAAAITAVTAAAHALARSLAAATINHCVERDHDVPASRNKRARLAAAVAPGNVRQCSTCCCTNPP